MRKRVWSILLAVIVIGGLVPSIKWFVPAGKSGLSSTPASRMELAWQILPTLANTPTHLPTPAYTITPTPLQPVPPTHTPTLTPTRAPIPTNTKESPPALPGSALIEGIFGYGQLLPLSCESRSSADWARHFGIEIHELDFFNGLPKSADPNEGFVGSVYGGWGNTPPGPYGVHAAPIAARLRAYGAKAGAIQGMSFDALKAELAAGKPVIVWVTGHVVPGDGKPFEVDGRTVTVAAYEHTVIAIGYDEETDRVTFLDGRDIYQRPYDTFFKSWGALENMAVVWDD